MGSIPHMDNGIVLNVRSITEFNEMNVAANSTIAPDRGLFPELNVANHLGADIHICTRVNLWVNTTKRSNHVFGNSNIGSWVFGLWALGLVGFKTLGFELRSLFLDLSQSEI